MGQHPLFPKVPRQPIHRLITHLMAPNKTRDIRIKDHGGIQITMQSANPAFNRAFIRVSVLKVPRRLMFGNLKHTQVITLSTALQQQSPLPVTLSSPLLPLDPVCSIILPVQNQKPPLYPQKPLTSFIIVLSSLRYQRDQEEVICQHDRIGRIS